MKTIQQLLELSKNPFYNFTPEEQGRLDDFLVKEQAKTSKSSAKKKSTKSAEKKDVVVRNIVKKTIDRPEEAQE